MQITISAVRGQIFAARLAAINPGISTSYANGVLTVPDAFADAVKQVQNGQPLMLSIPLSPDDASMFVQRLKAVAPKADPSYLNGNLMVPDPYIDQAQTIVAGGAAALARTQDELKAYAAARRWQKQNAGFTSQTFGPLLTDADTRSAIAQAIQSIDLGVLTAPINFKAPSGFVSLTRDQLLAMAKEIAAYVQGAFNTESTVVAGITNGAIATTAAIDTAFA